jgi:hypothetical protein
MRTADTVEKAIEIVRNENTECQMEWYSLGKTNTDLFEYLKQAGIDERALGVFIVGSLSNPPPKTGKLFFWPIDWVDLSQEGRDTARKYLATRNQ